MCVCASMKPGTSVASPRSITCAPAGATTSLPTASMVFPRTRMRPGETSLPLAPSNKCAACKTIGAVSGADVCALPASVANPATTVRQAIPAIRRIAFPMTWRAPRPTGSMLLRLDRGEEQVLVVEAEVGDRRDGLHRHPRDLAFRVEAEGHVGRFDVRVVPHGAEGVVVRVLQAADHAGRAREVDAQAALVVRDRDRAVPGIVVAA